MTQPRKHKLVGPALYRYLETSERWGLVFQIENLPVKSKKVKTAFPVFKPVGVLCAMLLGFYMTAAIACSSCAEFVRTALPANRIVWYQVVVVSLSM